LLSVNAFTSNSSRALALEERGYLEPTPVQAAVTAPETWGRDLLVSAQTGSGKTVAYGIAMAQTLLGDAPVLPPPGTPLALAIAPTRELALQVERELSWLYRHTGARICACVGGMDAQRERRALQSGVHIVVGTPGRLRDHIERGALDVSALAIVVLDEADEMLDLGFREDLEFMLTAMPAEKRSLLFSATVPKGISTLARSYQRDAKRIEVERGKRGHVDIENRYPRVLVATDVAARGIDLPNVGIVIHADLPHDIETLQHRSGRTGRAGKKGVSAILTPFGRRRSAERLFSEPASPRRGSGRPPPPKCARSTASASSPIRRSPSLLPGTIWKWRPACSPSAAPET
jgi:superfamily II DNA/RNA helicase